MQPAGGIGDKLFPPTYPAEREGPPRHVFERRRLDDREVWCVLIDSVQSQANRMEEALLAAAAEQAIPLPYVTVDFREAGLQPLQQITSLDAPHRVYDAIIRDSLLDDVPFMESEQGRRLAAATPAAATALLEISPSALLFGAWHSQGEGGGLGASKRDAAGRALLAALGLAALTEQDARGYALRSRCDLVCDGAAALELVHADGSKEPVEVSCLEARDLYCEAYEAAEQAGIAFSSITLKPQPKLVEIVRRSRELALEGEGRDGQGE